MTKESTHESWVGDSLVAGRYHVTALLETSEIGLIYQAHDIQGDDYVTLIVSHWRHSTDTLLPQGCSCSCIGIQTKLTHPHILPIIEHGTHRTQPFWMIPCKSKTLEQRRGLDADGCYLPMAVTSIANWIKDIAGAIDFSHTHGYFYHRIHSEMILFNQSDTAYLTNIVLAHLDEQQVTRPVYDAPELFEGGVADSRTDQYALAVLVHELLAGRLLAPAYRGLTRVLMDGLQEPIESLAKLPPDTPEHVIQALRQALSPSPNDRFTRCEIFADAFLGNQQQGDRFIASKPSKSPIS